MKHEPKAETKPEEVINTPHAEPVSVKDVPKPYGQNHRFQSLHKLAPGEPFFVLRAQDKLAWFLVEEWARKAEAVGCNPEKVKEARDCAAEMRAWQPKKNPD